MIACKTILASKPPDIICNKNAFKGVTQACFCVKLVFDMHPEQRGVQTVEGKGTEQVGPYGAPLPGGPYLIRIFVRVPVSSYPIPTRTKSTRTQFVLTLSAFYVLRINP